jgi:hypothetical protein
VQGPLGFLPVALVHHEEMKRWVPIRQNGPYCRSRRSSAVSGADDRGYRCSQTKRS